jgi:hypothetical protein
LSVVARRSRAGSCVNLGVGLEHRRAAGNHAVSMGDALRGISMA